MHAALGSWHDTGTKRAIVDFLSDTTQGPGAVPAALRLAAFDNDGTLACEKPNTSLGAFLADLTAGRPYGRSPIERLRRALPWMPKPGTEFVLGTLMRDRSVQQYEAAALDFLRAGRHPRFGRPWPELLYAPMRELMALLARLDFTVYVVSGSSRDFLRTMAEPAYGVTREHVIGTEVEIDYRDGRLIRTRTSIPVDRGPGKPAHFWDRSGGLPLFAAGNTLGDLELLEASRFGLLIDHDDPDREYDYTDEKVLDAARSHGWTVASMRHDFASVFADEHVVLPSTPTIL